MNYDYHCAGCNSAFEENLRMDDRDLPLTRPCPNCGAFKVTRGVSAPFVNMDGAKTLSQRARQGAGSDFLNKMETIQKRHPNKLKDGTKKTIGGY